MNVRFQESFDDSAYLKKKQKYTKPKSSKHIKDKQAQHGIHNTGSSIYKATMQPMSKVHQDQRQFSEIVMDMDEVFPRIEDRLCGLMDICTSPYEGHEVTANARGH